VQVEVFSLQKGPELSLEELLGVLILQVDVNVPQKRQKASLNHPLLNFLEVHGLSWDVEFPNALSTYADL
jgi:hypothetical protein